MALKKEQAQALDGLKKMIRKIDVAVTEIKLSGISDDALYTLITRAAGSSVTKKQVRDVCAGIERLQEYVFPSEG
jgi:hypothetical protein